MFLDKEKLKEFITSRSTYLLIMNDIFQAVGKWHQMEMWIYTLVKDTWNDNYTGKE